MDPCALLKTNRIKPASIFAALNQIRLAGIPYKCQQALVRFVVMAMVRGATIARHAGLI
jgi:hypothetical protein